MPLVIKMRDGDVLEIGDLGRITVTFPQGGRRAHLAIDGPELRPCTLKKRYPSPDDNAEAPLENRSELPYNPSDPCA